MTNKLTTTPDLSIKPDYSTTGRIIIPTEKTDLTPEEIKKTNLEILNNKINNITSIAKLIPKELREDLLKPFKYIKKIIDGQDKFPIPPVDPDDQNSIIVKTKDKDSTPNIIDGSEPTNLTTTINIEINKIKEQMDINSNRYSNNVLMDMDLKSLEDTQKQEAIMPDIKQEINDYNMPLDLFDVSTDLDIISTADDINLEDDLINQFKFDFMVIVDNYVSNVNNSLKDYFKQLLILSKDNSLEMLNKNYTLFSTELSEKDRFIGDEVLKYQVIKNQNIRLYNKLYSPESIISLIKSCEINNLLRKRQLDTNYVKEDSILAFKQNEILSESIKERESKYVESMRNIYKVLNSSTMHIDNIIKLDIKEKEGKAILLNKGYSLLTSNNKDISNKTNETRMIRAEGSGDSAEPKSFINPVNDEFFPDPEEYVSKDYQYKEFLCHNGHKGLKLDPQLVTLVQLIRDKIDKPIGITSSYRTPAYNKKIGGAPKSQHKVGRAADLNASGIGVNRLHKIAIQALSELGIKGGVGKYTKSNFVHVDVRGYTARWGS